jgi:hypothetical protein
MAAEDVMYQPVLQCTLLPKQMTLDSCAVSVQFNPLKAELLLNNIYKFSSYLTGNRLRLRCDQPVNAA